MPPTERTDLSHPIGPLRRRLTVLTETLWFLPGVMVLAFATAAVVLSLLESRYDSTRLPLVFPGDADAARLTLSSIAGSIITVAGLTLSITVVTLQLVAAEYTASRSRSSSRSPQSASCSRS